MTDIASLVLRKLGFERVGERSATDVIEVDLSGAVQFGAGGHVQVPLHTVLETEKFKRQVELLGEIAEAHREGNAGR